MGYEVDAFGSCIPTLFETHPNSERCDFFDRPGLRWIVNVDCRETCRLQGFSHRAHRSPASIEAVQQNNTFAVAGRDDDLSTRGSCAAIEQGRNWQ
jgi:hypothetical protein